MTKNKLNKMNINFSFKGTLGACGGHSALNSGAHSFYSGEALLIKQAVRYLQRHFGNGLRPNE